MITIVDYGMGNLGSILNMFKRIGAPSRICAEPRNLESAEKILLPGVGAFDSAMERLNSGGFREVLDHKAHVDRVPILGICLGMQLLTRSSEEGRLPGLGWINGQTLRFPQSDFVHSFFVKVDDERDSLLTTRYGVTFDAVIAHGNIFGAQFHPEKSHRFGMHFLSNFARI
jgi:glutamine amidotransferase